MSSICLLVLFVVNTVSAKNILRYNTDDASEHFETFLRTHNKKYDETEAAARLEIFTRNLEKINELNERSDGAVYGVTQFSDLTSEEFIKSYTGYKPSNRTSNFVRTDEPKDNLKPRNTPDSFDWRDQGVVTEVKNQGVCGSCWAFSTIGNLESAYAIKDKQSVLLSEQQLVDCVTSCAGCGGGDTGEACNYLAQYGSITEESYPYKAKNGQCQYDSKNVKVRVAKCLSLQLQEDEVADKLISLGPLSIALDGDVLQQYTGGILSSDSCQASQVNHAVLLVGYGSDNDGKKYWVVKNSWGTGWGEQGYFRMQRGVNCLAFTENAQVAAVVR